MIARVRRSSPEPLLSSVEKKKRETSRDRELQFYFFRLNSDSDTAVAYIPTQPFLAGLRPNHTSHTLAHLPHT